MGCDYYVNVGPVVHIKNPPVETTIKHKGCCNDKCKRFHQTSHSKFCPDCGKTVQEWSEPVVKSLDVDFYELLGGETLVPADFELSDAVTIVLVPNSKKVKGFQSFNLGHEGGFEVFPKIEEITDFIENFKKVFAKEIVKLNSAFGEQNVEVRYGTVGTVSC